MLRIDDGEHRVKVLGDDWEDGSRCTCNDGGRNSVRGREISELLPCGGREA